MSELQFSPDLIESFGGTFNGRVVGPRDSEYDDVRRVHNGAIDRRPAVIARCRTTSDVVDALRFGRENQLEIAVRGGGHNVAGRATVDGGIMIDLSPMKAISVDRDRRTARAQPGLTWAEFNAATGEHGLATTGGIISTTGIAGLTLGGGLGYLMPKYGMTVDNLLSAEVVLADGQVVIASPQTDPDLFWAIRGGGGNFGIVTSFEYRLHPVEMITAGIIAYPFDQARDVLRFYRDLTHDLPDEVMAFGGLVHAPDGSGVKLAGIVISDCRPPGTDDSVIDRVKNFGAPIMDAIQPMPYPASNQMLDGGYPKGAFNYWKASYLEAFSDRAIDALVEAFAKAPSPADSILLEHFHGAAVRVPVEATAFPHRFEGYNCAVLSEWMDTALEERCIAWARESYESLEPYFATARFMNYMGDDEPAEEMGAAYGPNLPRLRKLKSRYDPRNLFHLNQNIPPG